MEEKRKEIIAGIIKKGGLYSMCMKIIADEPKKCDQLITECFEQCHHKECWDHWGVALTLKIITYRLDLIRIPLKLMLEKSVVKI